MWGRGFSTAGLGAGGRGGTPGRPGRRGRGERARGERALGRSAQLPRAPGAGAACPGPVGLGLRAAGRGEENNRRGGREREARRERGPRGAAPCLDRLRAPGDPSPGPSGSPRSEKSPGPQTWQMVSSATHPHSPSARPGASGRGRVTPLAPRCWPFPSCWPHLPPPAAEWVGQPSTLSPPLLTLAVQSRSSDPPSPPASGLPLHPGDVGGKGESFRALPRPPGPRPSARLPAGHSPDRGCPALGTRSSSESVASSSFALGPLALLFACRAPRPLPRPCSFRRAVPCSSPRRLAALPSAGRPGPTPPPPVQLCSHRPPPPAQLCAARPPLEVPDVSPERLEGPQPRGASAFPDPRPAPPSVQRRRSRPDVLGTRARARPWR